MPKIFIFQELDKNTFRIRNAESKSAFLNQIVGTTDSKTINHVKNTIMEWKEYCNDHINKSFQLDENFDFKNKRVDFIYDSLDGKSEYNIYVNDSNMRGRTDLGLLKKKYYFRNGNFNYVLIDFIKDIKNNDLEFEK